MAPPSGGTKFLQGEEADQSHNGKEKICVSAFMKDSYIK